MLKVYKNPLITVPVQMWDNGEDASFSATFEILPTDRLPKEVTDADVRAFLDEAIKNLGDLAGDDGQPLVYSPEVKAAVLNRPDARLALFSAYAPARLEAVRGNLSGPPAPGSRAD